MTSQAVHCAAIAVLLTTFMLTSSALPRPQDWYGRLEPQTTHIDQCKTNGDVETLCQTCAKHTRSNIVYPMCCEEREEARAWCERYISFGRHNYN